MFRNFEARRVPWAQSWLFTMRVPTTFLEGLTMEELYWGQHYKEYVWVSRKQMRSRPYLRYAYLDGLHVMKGHILKGASQARTIDSVGVLGDPTTERLEEAIGQIIYIQIHTLHGQ
ncbi:hypothetical protein K470DRAFT_267869 [Piedraia hortae CBS 480.64]|uniref:Uncharacterized protein n=1 Tax=Piedraia hortae CBS 480.64 TaxID=1314780 RepID=A0A6A7C9F4_9PEZI|nr:hypothetical protein K470DRAFT_267869 [Piedraia hortae CBS 480.64]